MNCACRSVGKPGNGSVVTSTGGDAGAVAADADALVGRGDLGAGLRRARRAPICSRSGARVLEQHVAAGHGDRHGVGAGLDAVGQHGVARAVQARDALDRRCARCRRPRSCAPILIEAVGEIDDLRLARRVLDHRRAARRAPPPSAPTWVPPTVTFGKTISPPLQALRRARRPRSRPRSRSRRRAAPAP